MNAPINQKLYATLYAAEQRMAELSLYEFLKQSWNVTNPGVIFEDGWHIKAMCDHVQAWSFFEFPNLLINVPPRSLKSQICSVVFLPWVWATRPHLSGIFASYNDDYVTRDAEASARLIKSNWYQARWGKKFSIIKDTVHRFINDKGGYRLTTSITGPATGEGAHFVFADDPLKAEDGTFSEVARAKVIRWWDETMASRFLDPERFGRAIIMQRLHEMDLSGHVLFKGGYVHLCLPMEFEIERRCVTIVGGKQFFIDPRTEEGAILHPRIKPAFLSSLKTDMGPYGYAGQMQQAPAPRGGAFFKADMIRRVPMSPAKVVRRIRYWDKAGTAGGGAFTAGVKVGLLSTGSWIIEDVRRGQWSAGERERHIKVTAENDGFTTFVWVEQEPGSGGKESAEATIKNLAGFIVEADKVGGSDGNKEMRAGPVAVQVEHGNIYILDSPGNGWVEPFLAELKLFPVGKYKDQVDAFAGAFNKLSNPGLDYSIMLAD